MKDCSEFIASGILELYVLGHTTAEEDAEVQEMERLCPEVVHEILEIGKVYEELAMENAIEPDPIIRPFLLATIDYTERLKKGEPFSSVPALSESSKIEDYEEWISREDMFAPEGFEGIHAKILSYSPEMLAALVWLREMAPQEVHDNQYERFLILEGTCDITIGEDVYPLKKGDYLQIPLHKSHFVTVTSAVPCKVLLQRIAA